MCERERIKEKSVFTQEGYRCRLDWGRRGTRDAAERGDILVIVDTLTFSTAVATAVQHGGRVYPCAWTDDPAAIAARIGGEAAVRRTEVPRLGRFSLSPATYFDLAPGTRIVLASPNGATCSRYAAAVPYLFAGTLVNAAAVGLAVAAVLAQTVLNVTVIACGERWQTPSEDGDLRIAIEDYLAAGAILSYLPYPKSPEAQVGDGAFRAARAGLADLLWECGSGRELRALGFGDDVRHATRLNLYDSAPVMRDSYFVRYGDGAEPK
jgi:2-phosphosulfolactate phosphatase